MIRSVHLSSVHRNLAGLREIMIELFHRQEEVTAKVLADTDCIVLDDDYPDNLFLSLKEKTRRGRVEFVLNKTGVVIQLPRGKKLTGFKLQRTAEGLHHIKTLFRGDWRCLAANNLQESMTSVLLCGDVCYNGQCIIFQDAKYQSVWQLICV